MKWTIYELRKLVLTNNQFSYQFDPTSFLTEEDYFELISMDQIEVKGNFQYIHEEELFIFDVQVKTNIVMPCAITLEPVDVPIEFETSLEFSKTIVDDSTYLIDGITIDLDSVIFAEVMIEKPMKVVKPGAYEDYHEELVELDQEEQIQNNPFAKLKK